MSRETETLEQIRAAMQGHVRLDIVPVYFQPQHKEAVQVFIPGATSRSKWVKVGPLLFPGEGGTVGDTLAMLASMREGVAS